MHKPDISIIIPVYNEEENIAPVFEGVTSTMDPLGRPYEIIFVDDGSTDKSLMQMKQMKSAVAVVRIIKIKNNSGLSAAFAVGFKVACADIVVTMDSDLQFDPRDIPRLLERLADCDVVCGYRKKRCDPFLKRVSTRIANAVRNALSGENIRDTGCSLRAIKREFLANIVMYKGMHRFLPTLLRMQGARICEVEVTHLSRKFGRSKYNIRNRIWVSFGDLLFVSWMKKRSFNYTMEVIQ